MAALNDLKQKLKKLADEIPQLAKDVIEVEGLNFIKKNFRDEGFNTGSGVQKWQKRKTTDRHGRNITRYRTNRRGKKGSLNKYGRSLQGRPILTGHKTGGDKLRNSFKAIQRNHSVVFYSYKLYAKRHNEGKKRMPKRQFIGKSDYLDNRIERKMQRELDKRMKA